MANLDSAVESRGTTLLTEVYLAKATALTLVMRRREGWAMKAERQRAGAFELWCWGRSESPLDGKIQPVHPKGDQP